MYLLFVGSEYCGVDAVSVLYYGGYSACFGDDSYVGYLFRDGYFTDYFVELWEGRGGHYEKTGERSEKG